MRRPRNAGEFLAKGLTGGSGEAPAGVLSDQNPRSSSPPSGPGSGAAGHSTGSGGSGDGSLVAVYSPKPEYPLAARRRNIEGVSVVQITIDSSGTVGEAKLVETSGNDALDHTALETVKKWRYERKPSDAPLVPLTERIRFVFRLGE